MSSVVRLQLCSTCAVPLGESGSPFQSAVCLSCDLPLKSGTNAGPLLHYTHRSNLDSGALLRLKALVRRFRAQRQCVERPRARCHSILGRHTIHIRQWASSAPVRSATPAHPSPGPTGWRANRQHRPQWRSAPLLLRLPRQRAILLRDGRGSGAMCQILPGDRLCDRLTLCDRLAWCDRLALCDRNGQTYARHGAIGMVR